MSSEHQFLFTCQEVADALKVNVETVRRYIREEKIPAINVGREIRIKKEVFDLLLREGIPFSKEGIPS